MNIGYYAHSHGSGHCRQADKLFKIWSNGDNTRDVEHVGEVKSIKKLAANSTFTVFTSLPEADYKFCYVDHNDIIRLPDEHQHNDDILPGRAGTYWQPHCLHYSPVGSKNIQQRSTLILSQVAKRNIELMIVDVSVEVALLCRTASIPYLYVRLPGDRNDEPHLNAYQGALGLLAAYPEVLESADTPNWVRQKTIYLGFVPTDLSGIPQRHPLTRKVDFFNYLKNLTTHIQHNNLAINQPDNQSSHPESHTFENKMVITVIKGFGGHKNIDSKLSILRRLMPTAMIISLGPIEETAKPYVDIATVVDDVAPFLMHSSLLVMACGLNAIGEACQFNTPILVMPDERPHQEQQKMAQALIKAGRAFDFEAFANWASSKHQSRNEKPQPSFDSLLQIKPALLDALQQTQHTAFINSIKKANHAKNWFNHYLLPKLDLSPEM